MGLALRHSSEDFWFVPGDRSVCESCRLVGSCSIDIWNDILIVDVFEDGV